MPSPPNKRKILKESIIRLLQLGVSEKEIVENLKSVGIEEDLGRQMLDETKAELSGAKKPEQDKAEGKRPEKKEVKKVQKVQEETLGDTVPGDFFESVYGDKANDSAQSGSNAESAEEGEEGETWENEGAEARQAPGQAKAVSIPREGKSIESKSDVVDIPQSTELSELWEKGIIATVDSRLNEMKKIREELDHVLDQKISDKIKLEAKKVETVLESQRQLFYGKIDLYLAAKADDMKKVLESRAKQLEDANAKVQEQVSKIHAEKNFNSELLNTLNEKLTGLDTIRSQMISEVNQSLMVQDSKFREFMDTSVKKRDELEARITRSLQLESKITEGLVEDAKNKIESMRLEKDEELTKQVMDKVGQLDDMTKKVDPKGILETMERIKKLDENVSQRVKEIDPKIEVKATELFGKLDSRLELFRKEFNEYKSGISKVQDSRFEELRAEYANSLDDLFSQQLLAWDARLKEKEGVIDELEKKVDIDKINANIDSLELFKKQFVNTVGKSIDDYNKTKKELAQSIIERDKSINEYLERIDGKMKELSDFQKKFSVEVSALLENIPEEKTREKKSRSKE